MQINKKAKLLFKKLIRPGAVLRLLENENAYGLFNTRLQTSNCKEKVQSELVNHMIRQDWLTRSGNDLVISDPGKNWYKRSTRTNDPYLQQHQLLRLQEFEDPKGIKCNLTINDTESPLAWLRKRKDRQGNPMIDNIQFEAGERLRQDFTLAQLSQRVTADWSLTGSASRKRKHGAHTGNSQDIRDSAIEARKRFKEAIDNVGPELSGIITDVCCFLKGLEEAEKIRNLPKRSGKVVLQIGLSQLARHYGLLEKIHIKNTDRKHNGEEYRPGL